MSKAAWPDSAELAVVRAAKLLMGQALGQVADPDTMDNPESLAWFTAFAHKQPWPVTGLRP